MTNRRGKDIIQWRRLATEFAVIVTGVLVALVAEDWWSERGERIYEAELREDMVEEFHTNLDILDADLRENHVIFSRLGWFTNLSEEELQLLPDSAFAELATGELSWNGFDPMMGNVEALVRSGNIGAIADRELRFRLSTWSGLLDEKSRFTANAVSFQSLVFLPLAARSGADKTWSPAERRELHSNLRTLHARMQLVIGNQIRLSDAAQDLIDYLEP